MTFDDPAPFVFRCNGISLDPMLQFFFFKQHDAPVKCNGKHFLGADKTVATARFAVGEISAMRTRGFARPVTVWTGNKIGGEFYNLSPPRLVMVTVKVFHSVILSYLVPPPLGRPGVSGPQAIPAPARGQTAVLR